MILLDYKDRRPIYEQVVSKLEELMLLGVMKENEPLPSVRALAMDLSINPNTIQRAYVELERQGYIYTVKGKGSFVADNTVMKENRKKENGKKKNRIRITGRKLSTLPTPVNIPSITRLFTTGLIP